MRILDVGHRANGIAHSIVNYSIHWYRYAIFGQHLHTTPARLINTPVHNTNKVNAPSHNTSKVNSPAHNTSKVNTPAHNKTYKQNKQG